MNALEFRLTGRQASLAGITSTITRSIHRQLAQQRITRVELRYSTQSPEPLAPQAAKQAISNLLRENGFGAAAVSVRAHEGPIDDATGEHLLRLVPAEPAVVAQPAANPQPGGFRAWLARVFPMWFGRVTRVAPTGVSSSVTEPAPRKSPSLSSREAVIHLRKAVELATRYIETDTGTAVAAGSAAAQQVGEARVIVRLDSLHGVLGPLVSGDAAKAAQSIGPMVRTSGLATAPTFKVSYSYLPRVAGDGTAYATESDVEVRLILASALTSARTGNSTNAALRSVASESTALACGTLMPVPVAAQREATLALTLRVLGTLHADFAQPFEMHFASLPARFDRQALEQAGFARAHPGLLQVVSNSCPLNIHPGENGEWLLQAGTRAGPDGAQTPMYFMPGSLAGVMSPLRITADCQQLIVNAPGGVHDPVSGRVLPALVIELRRGHSGNWQRPLEFAA